MTTTTPDHDPAGGSGQYRYDERRQAFVATHDPDGPARLSTTVVHVLAAVAGTDVSQAEQSLDGCCNRDALDALFRPASGLARDEGCISVTALEFEVEIYADGEILLAPVQPFAEVGR